MKKSLITTKYIPEKVKPKLQSNLHSVSNNGGFNVPLIPILVATIVVLSFATGFLYGQVDVYENAYAKGSLTASPSLPGSTDTNQAGVQPAAAATVSIDQIKALFNDKKNLIFGNPNSKLLFVKFADPSCPYSQIATGKNPELNAQAGDRFKLKEGGGSYVAPMVEMKKLVDQGKAAFVWMYTSGKGNGELASQAIYCAQDQGKFWQVHDLLMSNAGYSLINDTVKNDQSKIPQLVDFLKGVTDAKAMQDCLESGKYADRIKSNETVAQQLGVSGTPSFFVNETNFGGAYNYTEMQSVVDAALK